MPFHTRGSIRYYCFDLLEEAGINHAIFTRKGGVSPHPWDTLNVGGTVGDDPERVAHNQTMAIRALGRSPDSIVDVWQVHGNDFVLAKQPRGDSEFEKADILLTDQPDITLFMRFADCVPVMLYDPNHRAVGLVHAGWQGTIKKAVVSAVKAMQSNFGTEPGNLMAGLGPSIGPHHYEVGPEVAIQVLKVFGDMGKKFLLSGENQSSSTHKEGKHDPEELKTENYRVKFDLWTANQILLEQVGVRMIEVSAICTACHLEDWYSHRGENGQTGRFGALIALVT